MDIQEVVDGLAGNLRRSVLVNDHAYRPVASSLRFASPDAPDLSVVLTGPSHASARGFLDRIGVLQARQPIKVKWAPFGGGERLAVPIRTADEPLGTLWLSTSGLPTLTSTDYSLVNAAVAITRDLLAPRSPRSPRASWGAVVPADLLHDDGRVRRDAFAGAIAERWLARGESTVLWAVQMDDGTAIERAAFGNHFASSRAAGMVFITDREGLLFFVSFGQDHAEAEGMLRGEAARRSLVVRSIGSARHHRDDDDLRDVARRARMAVRIAANIPGGEPTADIADVGPWVMLSTIVADRSHLALFSAAAVALWTSSDQVQRETVEAYLDSCGQVREACATLFVHRTTLYYRLEHLPEVVRDALADGMSRSTLHMCLKLIRYWESTGRL